MTINYDSATNWVRYDRGTSGTVTWVWNGPTCPACGAQYLGTHQCSAQDLQQKIDELQRQIDRLREVATDKRNPWQRQGSGCPCNPLNGGSGVCNCVMGGYKITS